jgi:acyl carrier protein
MSAEWNQEKIKQSLFTAIHFIAPEVDSTSIKTYLPLRDQIDIDSLDFVRLVIRIHEIFDVDVPESDYPKLTTLDDCVNYLLTKSKEGRKIQNEI